MSTGSRAVAAIVAKDLRLFTRDRFYVLVTVMGLVFFVGLFWVLPATVQATLPVGVHLPGPQRLLIAGMAESADEGVELVAFESRDELAEAVAAGDKVIAGLSFPRGFFTDVATGTPTTVEVLLAGEAPAALRPALAAAVRELAFLVAGEDPPVALPELEEMVLGEDRSDAPLALRDQLRPLLIFLVLMTEMLALASLVAVEIVQRTATAVLVTPVRVGQLLAAKALFGSVLAFGQALVVAVATGTLAHEPLLVLTTLLLGSLLVTGVGLLSGSAGQDFITTVFWGMLFLVPLLIPAFAVLFPGTPALWIRLLPSYGVVEVLVRTTGYGEGWAQAWPHLTALAAWCAAAFVIGTLVLGRRVRRV